MSVHVGYQKFSFCLGRMVQKAHILYTYIDGTKRTCFIIPTIFAIGSFHFVYPFWQ